MRVELRTERAKESVKDIKDVVTKVDESMRDLDRTLDKLIPERLVTTWSNNFKEAWDKSYKNGVQDIMREMLASAENLQNDIDGVETYSESGAN